MFFLIIFFFFFFFNDTATTEIYTLSLHDALPIWRLRRVEPRPDAPRKVRRHRPDMRRRRSHRAVAGRSEKKGGDEVPRCLGVSRRQRPGGKSGRISAHGGSPEKIWLQGCGTDRLSRSAARFLDGDVQQPEALRVVSGAPAKVGVAHERQVGSNSRDGTRRPF